MGLGELFIYGDDVVISGKCGEFVCEVVGILLFMGLIYLN